MKNKSGKVQMTIQNEISSKEVKIGSNLISQTTVKKTLVRTLISRNSCQKMHGGESKELKNHDSKIP